MLVKTAGFLLRIIIAPGALCFRIGGGSPKVRPNISPAASNGRTACTIHPCAYLSTAGCSRLPLTAYTTCLRRMDNHQLGRAIDSAAAVLGVGELHEIIYKVGIRIAK